MSIYKFVGSEQDLIARGFEILLGPNAATRHTGIVYGDVPVEVYISLFQQPTGFDLWFYNRGVISFNRTVHDNMKELDIVNHIIDLIEMGLVEKDGVPFKLSDIMESVAQNACRMIEEYYKDKLGIIESSRLNIKAYYGDWFAKNNQNVVYNRFKCCPIFYVIITDSQGKETDNGDSIIVTSSNKDGKVSIYEPLPPHILKEIGVVYEKEFGYKGD